MMESQKPNRRPVIAAAVAASGLMLVFGLAYRVVAAKLEVPTNAPPVSAALLAKFPLQIGDWAGEDVPMDEAIVRATDTDAHLNRRYLRRGGLEPVTFYVASGVKARDLMPHRPEVCYIGAGWTLTERRSVELPLGGSTKLPCNIMQFSRGAFNTQKVVVLDYYLVDGEYCADVSRLRSKAWRGSGTVRYVAQVQIIASITEALMSDSVVALVSGFAVDSAPLMTELFKHMQDEQNTDSPRRLRDGE